MNLLILKKLLNQYKLEDIKIKNGKFLINASEEKKKFNKAEQIDIKTDKVKSI